MAAGTPYGGPARPALLGDTPADADFLAAGRYALTPPGLPWCGTSVASRATAPPCTDIHSLWITMWKGGYRMLASPEDKGLQDQSYASGVVPMEPEENVDFGHVWHNTL